MITCRISLLLDRFCRSSTESVRTGVMGPEAQADRQAIVDLVELYEQRVHDMRGALAELSGQHSGVLGSTARTDCMASLAAVALRNDDTAAHLAAGS